MSKDIIKDYTKLFRDFLNDHLEITDEIEYNADLTQYNGYNSMLVVEIILYIEQNLGIIIPDELYALENYTSIEKIIHTVKITKLNKRKMNYE